jgi:hypothetical protein
VRRTLYRRQLTLAAIALLGLAAALATIRLRHPAAALPPPQGSYTALAGPLPAARGPARLSECGVSITASTEGVANPVLPCGIRVYLAYRDRTVLASVVAHAPVPGGREFALTPALARLLGLAGVHRVDWSYAGAAAP